MSEVYHCRDGGISVRGTTPTHFMNQVRDLALNFGSGTIRGTSIASSRGLTPPGRTRWGAWRGRLLDVDPEAGPDLPGALLDRHVGIPESCLNDLLQHYLVPYSHYEGVERLNAQGAIFRVIEKGLDASL